MYTCKQIARELHGVAFKKNQITFRSQQSSSTAMETVSDAELLQSLRYRLQGALDHMVSFANRLVTPEALQSLADKWPGSRIVEELTKSVAVHGTHGLISGDIPSLGLLASGVDRATQDSILQDLVDIIAQDPDFDKLSSIGYTMSNWDRWQLARGWSDKRMHDTFENEDFSLEPDSFIEPTTGLPAYTAATRHKILGWRPDPWWIPTKEDLLEVKKFISVSPEATRKHFYSATAVAIQFLQQLPPVTRLHLRKLVIEENRPSVAESYTHARGLIPFCQRNPQLRIEQRVDLWRADLAVKSGYRWNGPLEMLADWIRVAKGLQSEGMPAGSFMLVLYGPTPEASKHLADIVIKAAAWQAKQESLGMDTTSVPCLWGVCEGFSKLIQEVIQRKIPVQFEAEYGSEPWKLEQIPTERPQPWPSILLARDAFGPPPEGWVALTRELYDIGPDPLDVMEDWNSLMVDF